MKVRFSGLLAIVLALATHARAAVIVWDPTPTTFNDDPTQVLATGSLLAAVTMYGTATSTVSVNGVTFQNEQSVTNPNVVFHLANPTQIFGATSTQYETLVSTGSYVDDASASTGNYGAVLQNLTIGQSYTIQAWSAYWGAASDFDTRLSSFLPDGTANATPQSPTLVQGFPGSSTYIPQFALGTFTADATSQNVYYYGDNGYGIIGAFQVRTTPVPEPQTWALAALGVSATLFRLRGKQRSA